MGSRTITISIRIIFIIYYEENCDGSEKFCAIQSINGIGFSLFMLFWLLGEKVARDMKSKNNNKEMQWIHWK